MSWRILNLLTPSCACASAAETTWFLVLLLVLPARIQRPTSQRASHPSTGFWTLLPPSSLHITLSHLSPFGGRFAPHTTPYRTRAPPPLLRWPHTHPFDIGHLHADNRTAQHLLSACHVPTAHTASFHRSYLSPACYRQHMPHAPRQPPQHGRLYAPLLPGYPSWFVYGTLCRRHL